MATLVADAIEIITDVGNGVPSTYNNTAIGLASNGHFYLITERFGLDGTKTIAGATTRTIWYEGILTGDRGAFSISRNCEFVEAGGMEEVSGFNFTIKNTAAFWNTIKTNGVYLGRRRVKYYRVTSSDGITFTFELRWTGVIDEQPFNELTQSIHCVDNSKDIFKNSPVQSANDASFETASDKEKMIPIALGRVPFSPLVNISNSGKKTILCNIDDVDYDVAAITNLTAGSGFWVYTKGKVFADNDSEIVGNYLVVVAGGVEQSLRISSNFATTADEITFIYTDEPPDVSTPLSYWGSLANTATTVWYVQVIDFSPVFIASAHPISEFIENSSGRPAVSTYSDDLKAFTDVSEANFHSSTENEESTGFPGVSMLAKSTDTDGDPIAYFPVVPTSAKVVSVLNWTSEDVPAVGSDAPNLYDRSDSTYYTLVINGSGSPPSCYATFDLKLPVDNVLKQFDELYLLVNINQSHSAGSYSARMRMDAQGVDIYGRASTLLLSDVDLFTSYIFAAEDYHQLPKVYMGDDRSNEIFFRDKQYFEISSLIGDTKKSKAYNVIRISLKFLSLATSGNYTVRLQEIGIVGKRTVGVSSEGVFVPLKGELFGTTWDARKTASAMVENPVDFIEKMIRDYDTKGAVWLANHAYVIGDMVRGTADTGHIFLCTTAGTSSGTQPTWTDTTAATYTDGGVTWTEFREIPIDKTTYDAASAQRADWKGGRTLTEKKPSEEWYKNLLAQIFGIMIIGSDGNSKIKMWRENTTALATFDSSNIIQGSLGDMTLTPMSRVYNEIPLRYDYNYGSGKFNKQISITKADQPAFPTQYELEIPGTGLGTFTIEYVYPVNGKYQIVVTTTLDHGLSSGDLATLSGNSDGYDFAPTVISVTLGDSFRFLTDQAPTAITSTSGTLVHATTSTIRWKTYVTGIRNYAVAKALWEQCRASYLITKAISKLPEELGDCYWFIDPYGVDANGDLLWPDLDVGDEHAAVFYARNLVNWTAWQKKQITFEVIDNSTYSAREIGDPVYFNDAKLTNGSALLGWIHEKSQLPASKNSPARFKFGVTFNPEQLVDPNIIDENGATNDYDENGATDIIDENGA